MRVSWTQAATGALFLGLLAGMFLLPGRLLGPEHTLQVSPGLPHQSQAGSVEAAPPVPVVHRAPTAPRHAPSPAKPATPAPKRPVARPDVAANRLASVVVHRPRAVVRRSRPAVVVAHR